MLGRSKVPSGRLAGAGGSLGNPTRECQSTGMSSCFCVTLESRKLWPAPAVQREIQGNTEGKERPVSRRSEDPLVVRQAEPSRGSQQSQS